MSQANAHGLSRHIPAQVARKVRERCGFGCVVCGSAIIDYEHFDPEFKDATAHAPEGIILLCPTHHRAKGGFIARSTLAAAASDPYCKRNAFAWTPLDLQNATTRVGPFTAIGCQVVLEIRGERVIWFSPPETEGGPNRLNLVLRGQDGSDLVRITENMWHASASAADVKLVAGDVSGRIEVRDEDGPVFAARIQPPHTIDVTVYRSWAGGHLYALGREVSGQSILAIDGRAVMVSDGTGMTAVGCYAAASIG